MFVSCVEHRSNWIFSNYLSDNVFRFLTHLLHPLSRCSLWTQDFSERAADAWVFPLVALRGKEHFHLAVLGLNTLLAMVYFIGWVHEIIVDAGTLAHFDAQVWLIAFVVAQHRWESDALFEAGSFLCYHVFLKVDRCQVLVEGIFAYLLFGHYLVGADAMDPDGGVRRNICFYVSLARGLDGWGKLRAHLDVTGVDLTLAYRALLYGVLFNEDWFWLWPLRTLARLSIFETCYLQIEVVLDH